MAGYSNLKFDDVKQAILQADSALPLNSQKITGMADGVAATDAASVGQVSTIMAAGGVALGDLQKIGYTPGVSTGGFCDVVRAIKSMDGAAVADTRQVVITAVPVTEGAGNGLLAAASAAVGTVLKSLNPATGAHTMTMDTGSTGGFSFKVTDAVNEAVIVRVEVDGCRPLIKKIAITGN